MCLVPSQSKMTPSEKESQTISVTESLHKSNENKDCKDDLISETSSLQLYHNEWDDRQFELVQPTNFTYKDSVPQVSSFDWRWFLFYERKKIEKKTQFRV